MGSFSNTDARARENSMILLIEKWQNNDKTGSKKEIQYRYCVLKGDDSSLRHELRIMPGIHED
jgi:hypothetical protein